MKRALVIDHRVGTAARQAERPNRWTSIVSLLEVNGIKAEHSPEVYGATLDPPPSQFTDELRKALHLLIADRDVVLLHIGSEQHLVPEVLADPVFASVSALLFTGSPEPPSDTREFLQSPSASPLHQWIRQPIGLLLDANWGTGDTARRLSRCVDLLLAGTSPAAAVVTAFGDPKLDEALDHLWRMVGDGESLDEIRKVRDRLLPDQLWTSL